MSDCVQEFTVPCDLSGTAVLWAAQMLGAVSLDGLTIYAAVTAIDTVSRINTENHEIGGKLKLSVVPTEILKTRDTWAVATPDGRMVWSPGA